MRPFGKNEVCSGLEPCRFQTKFIGVNFVKDYIKSVTVLGKIGTVRFPFFPLLCIIPLVVSSSYRERPGWPENESSSSNVYLSNQQAEWPAKGEFGLQVLAGTAAHCRHLDPSANRLDTRGVGLRVHFRASNWWLIVWCGWLRFYI